MATYIINPILFLFLYVLETFTQDITEVIGRYDKYETMKLLHGGKFLKGMNDPKSETGEYPVVVSEVKPFYVDVYPVTNAQYWKFRTNRLRYRSSAEKQGWTWVLKHFVPDKFKPKKDDGSVWMELKGAQWNKPEGVGSSIRDRLDYPVVHVSHRDAEDFCEYNNKRLPSEDEWEFAARGGLYGQSYPWGDRYQRNRTNLWQGSFPDGNTKADGWEGISPVDAYRMQNAYGLYDVLGNVWEWTSTRYYQRVVPRDEQEKMFTVKGCSFIDSRDGHVNNVVRVSQRLGHTPYYSAYNVGFRCVRSAKHYWKKPIQPKPKRNPSSGPRTHYRAEMSDPDLADKISRQILEQKKRKSEL